MFILPMSILWKMWNIFVFFNVNLRQNKYQSIKAKPPPPPTSEGGGGFKIRQTIDEFVEGGG